MYSSRFIKPYVQILLLVVCLSLLLGLSTMCASSATVMTLSLEDETAPAVNEADRMFHDGLVRDIQIPAWSGRPAAKPAVTAACSALMDANTGQLLYDANAHKRRPNASTTKILTSILVIENCQLTDKITASKTCSETMFTSIHLKPGEQISVKDLLASLLIRSANDASVAAAEHVAGSVNKFAKMMNEKAKEIGCSNTHFVTPNGLYDPNHYSSAYDLCLMARYAFNYPVFNELIKLHKYKLDSRNLNRKDLVVFQKSKFLKNYTGADGVKSGYTKQSGPCYVGSATRTGWRLVSAVLDSKNVSQDTAALMNYGYGAYKLYKLAKARERWGMIPVSGGSQGSVAVFPERDVSVAVPRTGGKLSVVFSISQARAPITDGQSLGSVTTMLNGNPIETIELRSVERVDMSMLHKSTPFMIGCCILGCGMLLVKYGTTTSKDISFRGIRISTLLRDLNRRRQGRG